MRGRFSLERGKARDYDGLALYHYRPGRPATWADVWVVRHVEHPRKPARIIAIGVLSWPALSLQLRDTALQLSSIARQRRHALVNREIRTISRIIVHPRYRKLGIAGVLVRCLLHHCDTRYVEVLALPGPSRRLFLRAGLREHRPCRPTKPVYYLFDRSDGRW